MTVNELIRLIGDVLTRLDVLGSDLHGTDQEEEVRRRRGELDELQRTIVRSELQAATERYRELTSDLVAINADLQLTINEVEQAAQTLETMVRFVEVVGEIAEIVGGAA